MNRNHACVIRKYNELKCVLFNHLWIFALNSILNIILFTKMYFIYKLYTALYLICLIIIGFFIFIPIYPLILLYKKRLYTKKVIFLKKFSLFIVFIILFFGILIDIIIYLNNISLFTFFRECPYNFSYDDISRIFDINQYTYKNISNDDYSEECSNKRCLLINNNFEKEEFYSYLCNFDSSNDFRSIEYQITNKILNNIKEENNKIKCKIYKYEDFEKEENITQTESINYFILKSYYSICSINHFFYKCNRFETPQNFKVAYNYSCPNIFDNLIVLVLGFISSLLNLLSPSIILLFEFFIYKKILFLYQNLNTPNIVTKTSINKSTKNSSQIKSNIVENITNEIKSQSIIIESNNKGNNNNNLGKNNVNNENILSVIKLNGNSTLQNLKGSMISSERNNINYIKIKENNLKKNEYESNSNISIDLRPIQLIEFSVDNNKNKSEINESKNNGKINE